MATPPRNPLPPSSFYRDLLDNLHDGLCFVDPDRRITYWNKRAEHITGYASDEVVGRRCSDNLLVHVDDRGKQLCLEDCPVSATLGDGLVREAELFLHHRDGHRVPVWIRVSPIYGASHELLGAVEIFSDNTAHIAATERVKQLEQVAYIDPLTELANRRFAEITLASRRETMNRYGWRYGVVLLDIDHFKGVNDQYGHEVGDHVLKMVSKTLLSCMRSSDLVARWGGEEFLAILSQVDPEGLAVAGHRLCALVEQSRVAVASHEISVTVSAGATLAVQGESCEDLLRRADELLYQSKRAGRNRVSAG